MILPLQMCEHVYHTECLSTFLSTQTDNGLFPLICPEDSCRKEIADSDIRECLSHELYLKYEKISLNKAMEANKEYSWCPTPNCTYAFILSDDRSVQSTTPGSDSSAAINTVNTSEFKCPLCTKHYCLACRVDFHEGITC